jgi:hypothetical protein
MATKTTKSDVQSVGKKLSELRSTLQPGEQRVLDTIIESARGGDVKGFTAFSPDTTIASDLTPDQLIAALDDYLSQTSQGDPTQPA